LDSARFWKKRTKNKMLFKKAYQKQKRTKTGYKKKKERHG
jgi:hypothetical protein